MKTNVMTHLTLSTGHSRESSISEVSEDTLEHLRPWVRSAVAMQGSLIPLPGSFSSYSARASVIDGTLMLTVYGSAGSIWSQGEPIITMGVADATQNGQILWKALANEHIVAPGVVKPSGAWCAVAIQAIFDPAFSWLGDFERCVAWAWLTDLHEQSGLIVSHGPENQEREDVVATDFTALDIGAPFPLELPSEGAFLRFTPAGLEVIVSMANPNRFEQDCFMADHATKIGIGRYDRLGTLLFDFGEGVLLDAPFDAGLESANSIPDFSDWMDGSRVVLTLIGVNFTTGRVFGLRMITPSSRVSREIVKCVRLQSVPTVLRAHEVRLSNMYARYPTQQALFRAAIAMDKAGLESPGALRLPVPVPH